MSRLNLDRTALFTVTLSPAAVAMNTTAQQTFTVNGLKTTDFITECSKPTLQAGICVLSASVTAANTLGITFVNVTSGSITPTANEAYTVYAIRSDERATTSPIFI